MGNERLTFFIYKDYIRIIYPKRLKVKGYQLYSRTRAAMRVTKPGRKGYHEGSFVPQGLL